MVNASVSHLLYGHNLMLALCMCPGLFVLQLLLQTAAGAVAAVARLLLLRLRLLILVVDLLGQRGRLAAGAGAHHAEELHAFLVDHQLALRGQGET